MIKKKTICLLLAMMLLLGLSACGSKKEAQSKTHTIAVVVYSLQDSQVQSFRQYLENYIEENFPDVRFLYSTSITDSASEMQFLRDAINLGAEGVMAFNSYDLEAEVRLCADSGVYYIRPSSTVTQEDFDKVKDNPYFLGWFGPGEEEEYQAGFQMASWFAQQKVSDSYFLVTGGAHSGNIMHYQRTVGMLDALQQSYGVTFSRPSTELAKAKDPTTIEIGSLKITVFGGYIGIPEVGRLAVSTYKMDPAGVVLGAIPLNSIASELPKASLGMIDCYCAANAELFQSGRLRYLTGKYESIIAPAFAAVYNAICGHSEAFREDGHAFALRQGFWTSDSSADFQKKYTLSSGIALNAYSYDDLLDVISAHNKHADYDTLKALADAWDYDSAAQRRAQ